MSWFLQTTDKSDRCTITDLINMAGSLPLAVL